jgi:hypothetical protein
MSQLKDNFNMYWPVLVGVVLFAPAALLYYSHGRWEEEIASAALAVFGLICTVAPHEVAEWTGRYSWTYESFWTYPPTYLRFVGVTTQIGVLIALGR